MTPSAPGPAGRSLCLLCEMAIIFGRVPHSLWQCPSSRAAALRTQTPNVISCSNPVGSFSNYCQSPNAPVLSNPMWRCPRWSSYKHCVYVSHTPMCCQYSGWIINQSCVDMKQNAWKLNRLYIVLLTLWAWGSLWTLAVWVSSPCSAELPADTLGLSGSPEKSDWKRKKCPSCQEMFIVSIRHTGAVIRIVGSLSYVL